MERLAASLESEARRIASILNTGCGPLAWLLLALLALLPGVIPESREPSYWVIVRPVLEMAVLLAMPWLLMAPIVVRMQRRWIEMAKGHHRAVLESSGYCNMLFDEHDSSRLLEARSKERKFALWPQRTIAVTGDSRLDERVGTMLKNIKHWAKADHLRLQPPEITYGVFLALSLLAAEYVGCLRLGGQVVLRLHHIPASNWLDPIGAGTFDSLLGFALWGAAFGINALVEGLWRADRAGLRLALAQKLLERALTDASHAPVPSQFPSALAVVPRA